MVLPTLVVLEQNAVNHFKHLLNLDRRLAVQFLQT